VPELPEVEIVGRRLDGALAGAEIAWARAPGVVTMKTVQPPLDSLAGEWIMHVRRRGKLLLVEAGSLALVVHQMSAGRVRLEARRRPGRDSKLRLALGLDDGRQLVLREAGTRQRAWAKLLPFDALETDESIASLGPDAWPDPPPDAFPRLVAEGRHLHPLLRDQRVIAGIGRSWADEILWEAELSPFRKASDLSSEELTRLEAACAAVLGGAIARYEEVVGKELPQRLPMPLRVHGRQGEPCPRCGERLEAVYFAEHVTTYCPREQTGGRVLKDRRLSKLLR
jgi:formamidopyrimidine-DNA glycosylase